MSQLEENKKGIDDILFWCNVVNQCSIPIKDELTPDEKDALHRAIIALHTTTSIYTRT